ncbi:MAG: helix-turn-helix domain-containing protein [Prevotella sp.]|nr:helix-turn-helix domain-containing protein [Prevotella sp.]
MDNIVVLNEEQFEDIIYRTVSRCLNEKNIGNQVEKSEDEGFYDRDEICSLLHIAYPTLWRIEKSGILQSRKVGRKNLYPKQEVNQLIKSGKLAKYNHRN